MKLDYDKISKLDVKLVSSSRPNDKISCRIKISKTVGALIMPNLFINSDSRIEKEYTKIDYATTMNSSLLYIEGQEYLGTVKSLATDATVDLYMYKMEEPVTGKMFKFLLVIPSLTTLGEVDVSLSAVNDITGAISLVHVPNQVEGGSIDNAVDKNSTVNLYVKDTTSFNVGDNLTIKGISLPGITGQSAVFEYTAIQGNDGSLNHSNIGTVQYIELGDVDNLFDITAGESIALYLSKLIPVGIGLYQYKPVNHPVAVSKGKLVIPLQF